VFKHVNPGGADGMMGGGGDGGNGLATTNPISTLAVAP
jgi:hypothetical protein